MMSFSKEDRAKGVTSAELISCAPAPDREGELEKLRQFVERVRDRPDPKDWDNLVGCFDRAAALISSLEQEITTLRRQVETARADAFEEAAKIADLSAHYNGGDESRCEVAATIAREIRALNSLKTEG